MSTFVVGECASKNFYLNNTKTSAVAKDLIASVNRQVYKVLSRSMKLRTIAVAVTFTARLAAITTACSLGDPSPHNNRGPKPETQVRADTDRRASRAAEGTMAPHDFCQALQKNDRAALKAAIDPELAKLDPSGDEDRNFRTFKQWLERHACVTSVEIEQYTLRSDPPIKEFYVTVRMDQSNATEKRSIGVRLAPKRYEFDKK